MYSIELTRAARKGLASLPAEARRRVAHAVNALADDPRPPGAITLQGQEGFLRLRVGDYRAVYTVQDDRLIVLVVRVGHRRDVYRNL